MNLVEKLEEENSQQLPCIVAACAALRKNEWEAALDIFIENSEEIQKIEPLSLVVADLFDHYASFQETVAVEAIWLTYRDPETGELIETDQFEPVVQEVVEDVEIELGGMKIPTRRTTNETFFRVRVDGKEHLLSTKDIVN